MKKKYRIIKIRTSDGKVKYFPEYSWFKIIWFACAREYHAGKVRSMAYPSQIWAENAVENHKNQYSKVVWHG